MVQVFYFAINFKIFNITFPEIFENELDRFKSWNLPIGLMFNPEKFKILPFNYSFNHGLISGRSCPA